MQPRGAPVTANRATLWKKVAVGCLALVTLGGLTCAGAVMFFVTTNPTLKNSLSASQDFIRGSMESSIARKLSRTLCSKAVVTDARDVLRLRQQMSLGAEPGPEYRWLVRCHVVGWTKPPTCERVAAAFRKLQPEPGVLVVVVTAGMLRPDQPACSAAWDAQGTPLRGAWDANGRSLEEPTEKP